MSLKETPEQKTQRLQLEAEYARQQKLHAVRSERSTGMAKPAPKKKPATLFEAITGALKGGR